MTTLVFLLAVALIAGAIFALEGTAAEAQPRPSGLLTWVTSGNWPAKFGAVLILVGTGALLRYAAISIDIAPEAKLTLGVSIAALLGFASLFTSKGPGQRTLSLALGGCAFGVAYLTAYSAFALFGFLDSGTGIGLLIITAAAAGAFAVTRSAMSLALLAMVGAYLAPAFTANDPGPYVTYGYYAAATLLTACMVALRGWRPLIHLSFLFTLAGGVFFAWTAHYYTPEHFDAMAPMLWVLTTLHLALPLIERRQNLGSWIERLDLVYLLTLPLVATLLAVAIAPSREDLSTTLIVLGFIWIAAALYLQLAARDGKAAHAAIGTLLMAIGLAARFRGLPWDVIALAFAVSSLALAVYRSTSSRLYNVLAGLTLVLGAVHALTSLHPVTGMVFLNGDFVERLLAAVLLVVAARFCRKVGQPLDTVLFCAGVGWALLNVVMEIIRWELVSIAFVLHWILLAASIAALAFGSRRRLGSVLAMCSAIGILVTAAAASATLLPATMTLFVAPLALLALAIRDDFEGETASDRLVAVIVMPVVAAIWAQRLGAMQGIHDGYFLLAAAALTAALSLIVGRALPARSGGWMPVVAGIFSFAFAFTLVNITIAIIGRSAWAIAAELICLGGLGLLAFSGPEREKNGEWLRPAFILGAALILQAHLLRWFGPTGDLTILDITRTQWPALVSLLWAMIGASLTLWARREASRPLWLGGATLLIAAAIKAVVIDFGSLGELQNILAIIAAGIVFMLVGWLAPMPPAAAVADDRGAPPAGGKSPVAPKMASAEAHTTPVQSTEVAQPLRGGEQADENASPRPPTASFDARSTAEARRLRREQALQSAQDADDRQGSGRKIGWTIGLIAVGALVLSRCGSPVMYFAERSSLYMPEETVERNSAPPSRAVPQAQPPTSSKVSGTAVVQPTEVEGE